MTEDVHSIDPADWPDDDAFELLALSKKSAPGMEMRRLITEHRHWILLAFESESGFEVLASIRRAYEAATASLKAPPPLALGCPCLRTRSESSMREDRLHILGLSKEHFGPSAMHAALTPYSQAPGLAQALQENRNIIPLSHGFRISLVNCLQKILQAHQEQDN